MGARCWKNSPKSSECSKMPYMDENGNFLIQQNGTSKNYQLSGKLDLFMSHSKYFMNCLDVSFFEYYAKKLYDILITKEPVKFNGLFYKQALQNEAQG